MKKKAYAVIRKEGRICVNLIRDTKQGCITAIEEMFGSPWYRFREDGYRIKRVTVRRGNG